MKRRQEEEQSEQVEQSKEEALFKQIPPDVVEEITKHLNPENIKNVFPLQLVCKYFTDIWLPKLLKYWALCLFSGEEAKILGWEEKKMQSSVEYSVMGGMGSLSTKFNHREMGNRGNNITFLRDLFELQKHCILEDFWLYDDIYDQSGIKQGRRMRCDVYSYTDKKMPHSINELFYYDKAENKVIPMIDIPGLEEAKSPFTLASNECAKKRLCGLINSSTHLSHDEKELMLEGVASINDYRVLQARLYGISKNDYKMEDPGHHTHITNVVIHGIHIFSSTKKSNKIMDNLYVCRYEPPIQQQEEGTPYPEYCKEYVVFQHVTSEERLNTILRKLGLVTVNVDCPSLYDDDDDDEEKEEEEKGGKICSFESYDPYLFLHY